VVGDEHVHAERLGVLDLVHRGDPAIRGDEQPYPLGMELVDAARVEAVAVHGAIRNEYDGRRTSQFDQEPMDQGRATNAVHVIVGEHADGFRLGDGVRDANACTLHAEHAAGVFQIPQVRRDEAHDLIRAPHAPQTHQGPEDRGEFQVRKGLLIELTPDDPR